LDHALDAFEALTNAKLYACRVTQIHEGSVRVDLMTNTAAKQGGHRNRRKSLNHTRYSKIIQTTFGWVLKGHAGRMMGFHAEFTKKYYPIISESVEALQDKQEREL
jgi:hypothetical protein